MSRFYVVKYKESTTVLFDTHKVERKNGDINKNSRKNVKSPKYIRMHDLTQEYVTYSIEV